MGVFNSHIYMEGDGQRERFAALFFFILLLISNSAHLAGARMTFPNMLKVSCFCRNINFDRHCFSRGCVKYFI